MDIESENFRNWCLACRESNYALDHFKKLHREDFDTEAEFEKERNKYWTNYLHSKSRELHYFKKMEK